ncbi:ribonuclease III [Agitococcus lubricus]|uniref:Ribonuclease 3 n=1 Tax=Agitococcus lubricus TaxID=1077255 RepID=A0A2T5J072_9GAMM|nr:ribonuclease III [Agitococcus lubricus]PTQ89727.1 RNAse III [Agitococcus lubricus]
MVNYQRLMNALGYQFKDEKLIKLALTHRSVSGNHNNERLEFLGDSILGMIVADYLYHHFPQEKEGRLTRLRANLVKQDSLAIMARELKIGDYLSLGAGELKSGGFRRDSILADALEALLGAIYLDSGQMAICRDCVLGWYGARLQEVAAEPVLKDPKSRLQEYLQAQHLALPLYAVSEVLGEDHNQTFQVQCTIEQYPPVQGIGSSRRHAEQAAATALLKLLGVE